MAGIQDLLLAAQARKTPLQALLEGAVQGFGQGFKDAPARVAMQMEIDDRRAARERAVETDQWLRSQLSGAAEEKTQAGLRAAGMGPRPVTPGMKLAGATAGADGYLKPKFDVVEPKEPGSLDAIMAGRVARGEMTLEQAMDMKGRGAGESPTLRYQKEKDAQKAVLDEKELQIPGYRLGADVRPMATEAKGLRDGLAIVDDFTSGLDRLQELVKKNGSVQLVGRDAGEMQTLASQLKLSLKDVQKLGVLSASDAAFLDAQIGDPSSPKSAFTRNSTALSQLETTKTRARSAIEQKLLKSGYAPVGATVPDPAAGGAETAAWTAQDEARLAELETKAGKRGR